MSLSDDDVREILRIVDESELDELLVETDGFTLHVRRGAPGTGVSSIPAERPQAGIEETPAPGLAGVRDRPVTIASSGRTGSGRSPEAPTSDQGAPSPAGGGGAGGTESGAGQVANGLVTIESPMLGTFYRAEAPGAAPFVDVGAAVGPETTVCIIEVMKMMNSVPAGVSGTVAEVVAANGQLVEYGEPLFRVRIDPVGAER